MIKNFVLGTLLFSGFSQASQMPVIIVALPGLLGNRLFALCVANIMAERLGYTCYCEAIYGFPHTYDYIHNKPSDSYSTQQIIRFHDIEIDEIVATASSSPRNIYLEGYFQRASYLRDYRDKIRNVWLRIDLTLTAQYHQDPEDIVIHVRANLPTVFLPFSYYEKALSMTKYKRLYICTDEPNDPFIQQFKKYNPIIRSTRSLDEYVKAHVPFSEISKVNLDDFLFIRSFNKIIISHSSYSWWAAYLSDATEIYAPYSYDEEYQVYGKIDEPRYHYVDTKIGRG